jgi:hypothetical protein
MRGWIVGSEIGFDLYDAGSKTWTASADKNLAQEVAGYAARVAGEEGAREGADDGVHEVRS